MKPADINLQICEVYCENAMSDGIVRKWVGKFNESCGHVHDEPRSGRPSVVGDVSTGGQVLRGEDTETGAPF